MSAFIRSSTLWAYDYFPMPSAQPIHVGSIPTVLGTIDSLPEFGGGAESAAPGSPPTAILPADTNAATFSNLLLTLDDEVTLEGPSLGSLAGKHTNTPLASLSIGDVRLSGDSIEVTLEFERTPAITESANFEPKGALLSSLSVGGQSAIGDGISYVVAGGISQAVKFELSQQAQDGPVRFLLGGWSILYLGSIPVGQGGAICA